MYIEYQPERFYYLHEITLRKEINAIKLILIVIINEICLLSSSNVWMFLFFYPLMIEVCYEQWDIIPIDFLPLPVDHPSTLNNRTTVMWYLYEALWW